MLSEVNKVIEKLSPQEKAILRTQLIINKKLEPIKRRINELETKRFIRTLQVTVGITGLVAWVVWMLTQIPGIWKYSGFFSLIAALVIVHPAFRLGEKISARLTSEKEEIEKKLFELSEPVFKEKDIEFEK